MKVSCPIAKQRGFGLGVWGVRSDPDIFCLGLGSMQEGSEGRDFCFFFSVMRAYSGDWYEYSTLLSVP